MSSDKSYVLHIIKKNFKHTKISNNIRLPGDIDIRIEGSILNIFLSADAVTSNMQEDKSSFEGWALVLKRWTEYKQIRLSWEKPIFEENKPGLAHYQRFLFRVKHFCLEFSEWFSVSLECTKLLSDCRILPNKNYFLSQPSSSRINSNLQGEESRLEYEFSFGVLSNELKAITGATQLSRQLPVGVFDYPVSNKTKIFPKNKSAIDIWGINNFNELLIFELKANGNQKVGIISELYFYCKVMHYLQNGSFKYMNQSSQECNQIAQTNNIKGYFLCPSLHPLIDRQVISILNKANKSTQYYCLKFQADDPKELQLI